MIELVVLLAQSMPAPADAMISSTAVAGIIGAITTLVVGIIGKLKVDAARSQTNDVTLKKPVPTVETREKPVFVTRADLDAHLTRMDGSIRTLHESHEARTRYENEQRGNIHHRLDDQVKALARMEGTLEAVKETSNTLLNLALGKKPLAPRQ